MSDQEQEFPEGTRIYQPAPEWSPGGLVGISLGLGRVGCAIPSQDGTSLPMLDFWTLAGGRKVDGPTEPIDNAERNSDPTCPVVRLWFATKAAAVAIRSQLDALIAAMPDEG